MLSKCHCHCHCAKLPPLSRRLWSGRPKDAGWCPQSRWTRARGRRQTSPRIVKDQMYYKLKKKTCDIMKRWWIPHSSRNWHSFWSGGPTWFPPVGKRFSPGFSTLNQIKIGTSKIFQIWERTWTVLPEGSTTPSKRITISNLLGRII